jgi:hypothetical protein
MMYYVLHLLCRIHAACKHAANVQYNVLGLKLGRIQQYATANLLFAAQATLEQILSHHTSPTNGKLLGNNNML